MHLHPSYLGGPTAADTSSRPLGVKCEKVIVGDYLSQKCDRKSSQVAKCHENPNDNSEKSTENGPLARAEIGIDMDSQGLW